MTTADLATTGESGQPDSGPGQPATPASPASGTSTAGAAAPLTGDSSAPGSPAEGTPEAAQTEIDRLKADPEFVKSFLDNMHPGHKAAVEKMQALQAQAKPSGEPAHEEPLRQASEAALTPLTEPEAFDQFLNNLPIAEHVPPEEARENIGKMRDWMAEAGLSSIEAREAVRAYGTVPRNAADFHSPESIEKGQKSCAAALRSIWGDKAIERFEQAERAVAKLSPDGQLSKILEANRLWEQPWVVKALADAAQRKGW